MQKLSDAPADVQELAVDWPLWRQFVLDPGETVIVAGSYKGKLMELLLSAFPDVRVVGFEPQLWAWEESVARLEAHQDSPWEVYPYGLGVETGIFPMGEYHTDACSFINTESREQTTGRLYEYGHAKQQCSLDEVALFICNMEGYEFKLIPYMQENDYLNAIKRLAIQWHLDLAPGFDRQAMDAAIDSLSLDYTLLEDDRPAWTYHVRA